MFATIVILAVLGVFTIALEFFLPGGILGVLGVILLVASSVMAFTEYGASTGLIFTTCIFIFAILGLFAWLKLFPKLPGGRDLMLRQAVGGGDGQASKYNNFLERTGTAATDLRPAGKATIDGERLDVVAETDMIAAGTPVRVVAVEGYRIVVVPDKPGETPENT